MATPLYSSKLSKSKFKNWIKAGLGVLYTKEGIEPFVYNEIKQFQQKCLNDICINNGLPAGTTCSGCCTENVIVCPTNRICNAGRKKCSFHRNSATQYLPSGCPNKICHHFKNEIKTAHRFCGPSYKNTDASQWCSNAWEVAKCFMPPDGYKDVTNAAKTDFNGINSVIINFKAFQSKVKDDLSKKFNIFEQGREVGRAVRHSPQLEIEDTDLQQYFSVLQNLLSDPAYLSADKAAQNAKTKLLQLQNDTLVVGKDDVRKVLDDVGKVVQEEIMTAKEDYMKNAKRKTLQLIKLTKTNVSAIDRHGKTSMSQLDKAYKAAMDEIERQAEKSVEDVQAEGAKQKDDIVAEGHTVKKMLAEVTGQKSKRWKREATKGIKTMKAEASTQVKTIASNGAKQKEDIVAEGHTVKKKLAEVAGQKSKRLKREATKGIKTMKAEASTQVKTIASNGAKQKEDIVAEGHTVKKKLAEVAGQKSKRLKREATKGIKTMKAEASTQVKTIASKGAKQKEDIVAEGHTVKKKLAEVTGQKSKRLKREATKGIKTMKAEASTQVKTIASKGAKQKEDIVAEGHTVKRKLAEVAGQKSKRLKREATKGIKTMKAETSTHVKAIASKAGEVAEQIAGARDEVLVQIKKTKTESKEDIYNKLKNDLDAVPSDMDLVKIAQAIGLNWELLGLHLGLSQAMIDHIKMDNDTSQKRIYQMLYNWREDQGQNGTKQNLFTAFGSQPSTSIDWKTLGLSFPDALKYKPRKEKSTDTSPVSHAAEDAGIRDEEVTESADDKELDTFKAYIDKAWGKLVDYMIPKPILDCSVFEFRETRDIMEEKNTSEKNREILKKIRSKGADGYKSLKTCLVNTKQTLLVELLERIEKGEDTSLLEKQLQDKHLRSQAEQDYEERKTQLKEDLIDLYRERHHTLPMSPLMEENDTPLLKFYVMPDIESVEIERARGGGKEIRSKVTSLHDVFYKEKEPCRKIYLAADAGFGKTALSKRLVLTWCQAKKCIQNEKKYFKKGDISTMSKFEFVFLLSLRDCSEEWDIDEMIKKQIIQDLAHTISTSDFENILSREKCLIILDGLDEFTHVTPACKQGKSDIPHRRARRKCTILTTTRPWKLGVSKIRASEIERKLELIGLSKTSAKSLKRTVISLLCGKTDIEKDIQEFDRAISDRGISDLETIPLLLMYLLCLWCDGIELGASRTELYCQTIELLLKRTFEKYPDMQQSREQSQSDIPQCFSEHEHCKEHYTFLQALGQLAFETLFSENKESTLVFSQSVTEKHLTPEYLKLSLNSGMLTQSTEKTLTKQISKFSFSHKTVHEFFCALYISCQNENDVKNIVLNKCKSLQSILDMSTVLVFISGMVNAEIISSISQEFLSVISEDKITSEYRSTTDLNCKPLKDIQDMYISCMKENTSDKELKLFCQDFFFSEDCKEEKYFSYLARLAGHNKNNMASIYIHTENSGRSLREIIDCCELHELFQINKIFYCGKVENAQLRVLLDKSPKCVAVESSDLRGSWSREMLETLQNNSLLQAIDIYDFKMSHDVLNDFLNYIINRKTMTEIILCDLYCTEHVHSCTFSLDFSQHSGLRKLELGGIPEVSQLKVNSQVKHVKLWGSINLGEMSLPPEMANIESVYLERVNMSASTLRDLVKVVEKLSHKVTVTIDRCEIEPETEFEHVKQYIHSSQNFRVIPDDFWEFVFETKVES